MSDDPLAALLERLWFEGVNDALDLWETFAIRLRNAGVTLAAPPSDAVAPLPGHQTPGEYHDYRVACAKCGEPGFLHVSWRPETYTEEADHD